MGARGSEDILPSGGPRQAPTPPPGNAQDRGAVKIQGTLQTFGHEATEAHAEVVARSVGWRATRAGAFLIGGLGLAPVVAVLPPHVAWALGSAVTGFVLGARKWAERFSLLSLEGACPRCGAVLHVDGPVRLRNRGSLSCETCHHAATLVFPEGALEATSQARHARTVAGGVPSSARSSDGLPESRAARTSNRPRGVTPPEGWGAADGTAAPGSRGSR